ncbi:hypothetical protein PX699_13460 [Sphingobium sp. H39-3-25]|nr:hypothetical protein [Sphingobium arseniciresistens]
MNTPAIVFFALMGAACLYIGFRSFLIDLHQKAEDYFERVISQW